MFTFTLRVISKKPSYLVKCNIGYQVDMAESQGPENSYQMNDKRIEDPSIMLMQLRNILQEIIPTSMYPKYNLSNDALGITIEAENMAKVNIMQDRVTDFVRSGARSLNQRVKHK